MSNLAKKIIIGELKLALYELNEISAESSVKGREGVYALKALLEKAGDSSVATVLSLVAVAHEKFTPSDNDCDADYLLLAKISERLKSILENPLYSDASSKNKPKEGSQASRIKAEFFYGGLEKQTIPGVKSFTPILFRRVSM